MPHSLLPSYEAYLRNSAVPKSMLDVFLDPDEPSWARFDPEVGYILNNYLPRDGVDGSCTISTAQANGTRTAHMYTDRPCRINTYGNSFTQCHQVSDGETWQEYLAAHLGEPVRNFGMGGFGTYQAYRRMVRTEQSPDSAEYVILYIWGDDHFRSVMRCRHAAIYSFWDHRAGQMFHNNFWANLEYNLEAGRFVEKENLLDTPEALYKMTDPDYMLHALNDDMMLQLSIFGLVDPQSLDLARLNALADALDAAPLEGHDRETLVAAAVRLKQTYGFAATRHIISLASALCEEQGKKLLVCLLCPAATRQLLAGEPRYEQPIANFLAEGKYPHFDMNLVHQADYAAFNLSIDDYMKRYFIGHYSPAGNHFFAHALKDTLIDLLNPKPITYRDDAQQMMDFGAYLS